MAPTRAEVGCCQCQLPTDDADASSETDGHRVAGGAGRGRYVGTAGADELVGETAKPLTASLL